MTESTQLLAVLSLPLFAQLGKEGEGGGLGMWPAFLMIGVLFYFLVLRPQRKEQAARQTLLEGLKKNDRVVTAGGIYGVVTDVRKEADLVKVRVDEKSNVELRFTFASITKVIRDEPSGDQDKGEKSS